MRIYRIGPTVWLELGPMPMENRSNVEMTACSAFGGKPTWFEDGGREEAMPELAVLAAGEVELYLAHATGREGRAKAGGRARHACTVSDAVV